MTPYPLAWPEMMPPPGGRFVDLSGRRYGALLVLGVVRKSGTKYDYRCRCDCGEEITVRGEHLKQGRTVSCGCRKVRNAGELGRNNVVHGESSRGGKVRPTATYRTWKSMKERCQRPEHKSYARYGGRGIVVCDRWLFGDGELTGFQCFLKDMGARPSEQHSIDRFPDNDGNYEPSNCRWATPSDQHWTQRGKPRQGTP